MALPHRGELSENASMKGTRLGICGDDINWVLVELLLVIVHKMFP
jgi:hypothetical protein